MRAWIETHANDRCLTLLIRKKRGKIQASRPKREAGHELLAPAPIAKEVPRSPTSFAMGEVVRERQHSGPETP